MRLSFLFALLAFSIIILPAQNPVRETSVRFVAHRGASYLAPENTLASINLAWELGADAAECDVMLTTDNRVILFHDKDTKKLTGQSYEVSKSSWEQLSKLTIRPAKSNLSEYDQEPIPLLQDVLVTIPDDRMLVIEIKTGTEILPFLKEVVDGHWTSGKISFIAFDFETIQAVKELYPEVPCYYLSMFKRDAIKHLNEAVKSQLDGLDLRHGIIDEKLAGQCRKAGLDLWCWTVNDPVTAARMQKLGVSAITTDRPKWLRENMVQH